MIEQAEMLIEETIQAAWTGVTKIAFDNVRFTPEIGVPFIRLTIDWIDGFSVGPGRTRNTGLVLAEAFIPLNIGSRASAQAVDMLNTILQSANVGHMHIFPARVQRIGENKGWYQRNLLVPFNYDYCK